MATRTVQLGDRTITIEGFRAFKAIRAGEILTTILNQVPTLGTDWANAANKQREEGKTSYSRAVIEFQNPEMAAAISDEAWEASGGVLEIPGEVDLAAQFIAVWPKVFGAARDNVLNLLALLAAPNSELRSADQEGEAKLAEVLANWRKTILYDAEMSDLIDLLLACVETIREQFSGKGDEVGKLLRELGLNRETPTTETGTSTPSSGKNGSSPGTSSPSQDGPANTSSLVSPGVPSSG